MRAGPMVSATSWSCKLSTPHSHRHQFCIAIARFSVQALRSLDHRNPTSAQRASPARSVSPLVCGSDCLPASPVRMLLAPTRKQVHLFLDCIPFLQENDRFGVKSSNKTPTNNWPHFIHFRDEFCAALREKISTLPNLCRCSVIKARKYLAR